MGYVMIESEAEFDEVVRKADRPVLVEFWGMMCCQCESFEPLLDRIMAEYDGQLVMAKVNALALDELSKRCRVVGIPTTVFYWKGEEVYRLWGASSEDMFRRILGKFLDRMRAEPVG